MKFITNIACGVFWEGGDGGSNCILDYITWNRQDFNVQPNQAKIQAIEAGLTSGGAKLFGLEKVGELTQASRTASLTALYGSRKLRG